MDLRCAPAGSVAETTKMAATTAGSTAKTRPDLVFDIGSLPFGLPRDGNVCAPNPKLAHPMNSSWPVHRMLAFTSPGAARARWTRPRRVGPPPSLAMILAASITRSPRRRGRAGSAERVVQWFCLEEDALAKGVRKALNCPAIGR